MGESELILDKAIAQLNILNRSGWIVKVWAEDECYLYVVGTDNYGDKFRGRISRYLGDLDGEPNYD